MYQYRIRFPYNSLYNLSTHFFFNFRVYSFPSVAKFIFTPKQSLYNMHDISTHQSYQSKWIFVYLLLFFFLFTVVGYLKGGSIPRKKTVVATAAFLPQQPQSYIHTEHRTRGKCDLRKKTVVATAASLPQSPQLFNHTEHKESAFCARKQSWQLQNLCYMKPQSYVHTSTKI